MSKLLKILLMLLLSGPCCRFSLHTLNHSSQRWGMSLSVPSPAEAAAIPASERVYVGAAACQRCHQDGAARNQFNTWYLSAHARAYASLAMPESDQIARLSGIDLSALDSPICLGCHATAADTEHWERDKLFFLEDGIQCEHCHGPGSEYMDAATMADRNAAMRAGLRIPTTDFCRNCHERKDSHLAAAEARPFDYQEALKKISHKGRGNGLADAAEHSAPLLDGPKYIGVMACARCHKGSEMGFTFSKWRLSRHADAYVVLSTDRARDMAREMGVAGNPQQVDSCLECHATGQGEPQGRFVESFEKLRGVQCESCHGAGSQYGVEAVMRDPAAAQRAGLRKPTGGTCERCHTGIHGKTFDRASQLRAIDHKKPAAAQTAKTASEYKTPFNLALTRDGRKLFVVCEGSDSVMVVDTRNRRVVTEIKVQNQPNGICLSPDENRVFVSNRGSDTVCAIDAHTCRVVATMAVGDEPHGLITDSGGNTLFVANAGSHDISVIDLRAGHEVKRLAAGRGAWAMSRSPDDRAIFVTNNLSHFVKFRAPSRSEVTVLDPELGQVRNRIMIPEANLVQGIDVSPDGEFALVTLLRTKNLVPIVRVIQGWVITNGIGVLWKDGRVDQLLLDEVDNCFADPNDVVITPDGRHAYVSGGGVDAVAVVDLQRLKQVLSGAGEEERKTVLPNHLGIAGEYVVKRIAVGRNPRGMAASRDGRFVYVADALDDKISVIDTRHQERVATIDLGGPEEITLERMGERIFHSAEVTYGRQFSCHSCHPDGGIDGLTYDIEPDGLGVNPVDNRTLRGILDTAPFKWTGKNPSLSRQCGPRLAVFFTRIDPFTPEQVRALDRYICTIPRNPNRYRSGAELTPAQRRGKQIFERSKTNTGEEIPFGNRCNTCHPGPYFTNRQIVDVGTRSWLDTQADFDVPHLNNIYETAPFLHDGQADTLEEIWTRFNSEDRHGVTNDMTKDQLNDLMEYLKTL